MFVKAVEKKIISKWTMFLFNFAALYSKRSVVSQRSKKSFYLASFTAPFLSFFYCLLAFLIFEIFVYLYFSVSWTLFCTVQLTFSCFDGSILVVFCRARAEVVKDRANDTMQTLDMSEEAAKKARKALHNVYINLNTTRIAEVMHAIKGCEYLTAIELFKISSWPIFGSL